MAAGACDLEGAFDVFLTFDVGEVEVEDVAGGCEFAACVDDGAWQRPETGEMADDAGEIGGTVDFEVVDDCGFGCIGCGEYHAFEAEAARFYRHGQDASDWQQAAVERQFAHYQVFVEVCRCYLFGAGEDAYRYGKVVGRTLFAHVGGGEVDDDVAAGQVVACLFKGRFDALVALFDGCVGEADDAILEAFAYRYFDCYGNGVNAFDGGAVDLH